MWRLGLDVGTNSIGWAAFRINSSSAAASGGDDKLDLLDMGVRIFPDAREPSKSGRVGDSLAVARRQARGMRRNREHKVNRVARLVANLIRQGLLPEDETERARLFQTPRKQNSQDPEQFNPYRLRAEALERPLTPYELGRVIFHLGTRRGYKSNRKTDSSEETGVNNDRIKALAEALGERTLGQLLWQRYCAEKDQEKAEKGYKPRGIRFRAEDELYPSRQMYAQEFEAIRAFQHPHHTLTDEDWDRLRDESVLFQHPLKPVERGLCEFLHAEGLPRHWKDTPIGHDFRIYQELNNLQWIDSDRQAHHLDREQIDAVLDKLLGQQSVKFTALRKLKREDGTPLFDRYSNFNIEDDKRKELKGHKFAARFTKEPELLPLWENLPREKWDDIFEILHTETEDEKIISHLTEEFGFSSSAANTLALLPLASGTTSVSRKFMEQAVDIMRDQGLIFSEAVKEMTDHEGNPLHHSLRDDGRRWPRLPYYGEALTGSTLGMDMKADPTRAPEKHFGKINNPTVHVALNQLRLLINQLTDRFGEPPHDIHVEVTRELKVSRQRRDEITKQQADAQHQNKQRKKLFQNVMGADAEPSPRDYKKIKLWEELGKDELGRCCIFSGKLISAAMLFNGEAEIEHLLPWSATLDDSMSNLTICRREANRLKAGRTPYKAFADNTHADKGYIWEEIMQRVDKLPRQKQWRFGPDALQRAEQDGGFIARQLNDTAYIARATTRYLKGLEGVENILANPGRLTALVRGKWGLNGILSDDNFKSRQDHRHHAVDAAVVALTDRSLLQKVAQLSGRGQDDRLEIVVPPLPDHLAGTIRARVPEIIVSYKSDHGLQGQMYKETAYGFVPPERRDPDQPGHTLVTRKPLADLSNNEIGAIRDRHLRERVREALYEGIQEEKKPDKILAEFGKSEGIKKVRLLVSDQTVSPISSALYKGYKPDSYVCCDIWAIPKGKPGAWRPGELKWEGAFWSYAETVGGAPDKARKKPHPAARFVMRLFKDDMVEVTDGDMPRALRIAGFSTTNNKLDVKPHNLTEYPQTYVSINVLAGKQNMRKLRVTPDGRILNNPKNVS